MKGKKKEDFDCQNFEAQALKAMYEGKSLEQGLVQAVFNPFFRHHLHSQCAHPLSSSVNIKRPISDVKFVAFIW